MATVKAEFNARMLPILNLYLPGRQDEVLDCIHIEPGAQGLGCFVYAMSNHDGCRIFDPKGSATEPLSFYPGPGLMWAAQKAGDGDIRVLVRGNRVLLAKASSESTDPLRTIRFVTIHEQARPYPERLDRGNFRKESFLEKAKRPFLHMASAKRIHSVPLMAAESLRIVGESCNMISPKYGVMFYPLPPTSGTTPRVSDSLVFYRPYECVRWPFLGVSASMSCEEKPTDLEGAL